MDLQEHISEQRPGRHPFDPQRPWEAVYTRLNRDESWWKAEFEEAAGLVRSQVSQTREY